MKLNVWQRIWVVITVPWVLIGGWAIFSNVGWSRIDNVPFVTYIWLLVPAAFYGCVWIVFWHLKGIIPIQIWLTPLIPLLLLAVGGLIKGEPLFLVGFVMFAIIWGTFVGVLFWITEAIDDKK